MEKKLYRVIKENNSIEYWWLSLLEVERFESSLFNYKCVLV